MELALTDINLMTKEVGGVAGSVPFGRIKEDP